jgi:hypothetical protein
VWQHESCILFIDCHWRSTTKALVMPLVVVELLPFQPTTPLLRRGKVDAMKQFFVLASGLPTEESIPFLVRANA